MRRLVFIALGMVGVLSVVTPAQAQVVHFVANLSGSNETSLAAGATAPGVLTGAFGTARVDVDLRTQTVTWTVEVFNLPSGATAGHFHVGGPGQAGPTVVNFTIPANISNDFTITGSATSASTLRPDQGIRSWDDFIQSLVGEQTYINIHTTVNPGGEIRGQVLRVP